MELEIGSGEYDYDQFSDADEVDLLQIYEEWLAEQPGALPGR